MSHSTDHPQSYWRFRSSDLASYCLNCDAEISGWNHNSNLAWHSAGENVGWGTPGNSNSQYKLSEISDVNFHAVNEVFSPDNDGFEDVAIFSYKLDQIGMVGNAFVYDNRGRLIKSILTNE